MAAPVPVGRKVLYPHAHWYFLLGIVTTWVGFSRSYFMRLSEVTVFHHIHGALAGLWMALLIVQPILYQRGRMKLHRRLGRWGAFGLFPLLMLGGAYMVHFMLNHAASYPPGVVYTLSYLDAWSMVAMPLFVALGIYYGRNVELHARYMACTVIVLVGPALERVMFMVPGLETFHQTLNCCYAIMMGVLLLLVLDDYRKGRVRAPYLVALALYVPMTITMNYACGWEWWRRVADWYAAVGV